MPRGRPRKGKIQEKLSTDEYEELEALGYNEEEIAIMEKRLATDSWEFESQAETLFLNLSFEPDLMLKSGKIVAGKNNRTAKFYLHAYPTTDRRQAFLIYTSEAFRDRETVWDKAERVEEIAEEKYREFKELTFSDPERLARLRADLEAEARK